MRVRFGLALGASVAAHVLLTATLHAVDPYAFDFRFERPSEVNFGMADAVEVTAVAGSGADDAGVPPADAEPTPPPPADGAPPTPALDEQAAAPPNKEPPTEEPAPPKPDAEAAREDDVPEIPAVESTTEGGPLRVPAGAHIALRIDMTRIRNSIFADDVRTFVQAVPDWQKILGGTTIDPVNDLDRLLVASPSLMRADAIISGRHLRDESFVRTQVRTLARTKHAKAAWTKRAGVKTAPWHNPDPTQRIAANLGDGYFAILRPQDLEPMLAVMTARAERATAAPGENIDVLDAWFGLGPSEGLSLEVEGARRFVLGNVTLVPTTFRMVLIEDDDGVTGVRMLCQYENEAQAAVARDYFQRAAKFYESQMMVRLSGFGGVLKKLTWEIEGSDLRIETELGADQLRLCLSFIEGYLRDMSDKDRELDAVRARAARQWKRHDGEHGR